MKPTDPHIENAVPKLSRTSRKAMPYIAAAAAALVATLALFIFRAPKQQPVGPDGIQIKGAAIQKGVSCQFSAKGPDNEHPLVSLDSGGRQAGVEAGAAYELKGSCSKGGFLHVAVASGVNEIFFENIPVQVGNTLVPLLAGTGAPVGFSAPPAGDTVRVSAAFSENGLNEKEREHWRVASRFGETMDAKSLSKEVTELKWSGVFQLPSE